MFVSIQHKWNRFTYIYLFVYSTLHLFIYVSLEAVNQFRHSKLPYFHILHSAYLIQTPVLGSLHLPRSHTTQFEAYLQHTVKHIKFKRVKWACGEIGGACGDIKAEKCARDFSTIVLVRFNGGPEDDSKESKHVARK
jgi:hypothetical protein